MGVRSSKGKANIEIYVTLNYFFDRLANEGLPFATRLVREETRLTTRDNDTYDVVLPPHMSNIYAAQDCAIKWDGWWGGKLNPKQHMNRASNLFKDLLMTIVMYRSGPQDQNHRRYSAGHLSSHTRSKSFHILRYKK